MNQHCGVNAQVAESTPAPDAAVTYRIAINIGGIGEVERFANLDVEDFRYVSGPRDDVGQDGEPDWDPAVTYEANFTAAIMEEPVSFVVRANVIEDGYSGQCTVTYSVLSGNAQWECQNDSRWINRIHRELK